MQAGAPATGAPATGAGTASGHVTDVTGAPATEFCVYFFDAALTPPPVESDEVQNPIGTTGIAVTDDDGRYRIDLGVGTYRVLFSECAIFPGPLTGHRRYVAEWYSDKPTYEEADRVSTGATELVLDAVVALRSGIEGIVVDEANAPLGDICVKAEPADGSVNHLTRTAHDGSYRLLPDEGLLKVHFYSCDGWGNRTLEREQKWWKTGRTFDQGTWIDFRQGEEVAGIDTELDPT